MEDLKYALLKAYSRNVNYLIVVWLSFFSNQRSQPKVYERVTTENMTLRHYPGIHDRI